MGIAMDTVAVTIRLTDQTRRTAERIASVTQRPLDSVVEASLAQTLPPLDDLPEDESLELAQLSLMEDGALWRLAREMMATAEREELTRLLDHQSDGVLAAPDLGRLNALLEIFGRMTVRKAHARLLLARRGYRLPEITEA